MATPSGIMTLSVPGSDETIEMQYLDVVSGITNGEITPDRQVWNEKDQKWVAIADMPQFRHALHLAKKKAPKKEAAAATPEEKRAREKAEKMEAEKHRTIKPAPYQQMDKKKKKRSSRVDDDSGPGMFATLMFIVGLAVLGLVAANYVLIDQPLGMNLAKTKYAMSPVHAHLGSFVQPGALVVHLFPNPKVKEENLTEYLFTIAKSTPPPAYGMKPYDLVALTSSWTAQYLFSGPDWIEFSKMDKASDAEQRTFFLEHLRLTDGQPVIPVTKDGGATPPEVLDKTWHDVLKTLFP